jgi:hypothetical protein
LPRSFGANCTGAALVEVRGFEKNGTVLFSPLGRNNPLSECAEALHAVEG